MDKETLSNYGWIVICVLVLAVMIALATPFGTFVADGFKATYTGLFDTGDSALDVGLNAVGVSNKLPCGHGRKDAGDHSQKECGHFNCIDPDCGCVPASCGVEGHWSGDGKEHGIAVTSKNCYSGHTYTCECALGWQIPEGGTYSITFSNTYNEGEYLPCGYGPKNSDIYKYGDFKYTYKATASTYYNVGWQVNINTDVTDKNQTSYGIIVGEINNQPVTNMYDTFYGCKKMTVSPEIPNSVTNMKLTYNMCESLIMAPVLPNGVLNIEYIFANCTSLTTAPIIPSSATNILKAFDCCRSLKTYHGSTDPDGDFSNYPIPNISTSIFGMFESCYPLIKAPKIPSKITDVTSLFRSCSNITGDVEIPCTALIDENTLTSINATLKIYHVDGCDGSCGR